MWQYVATLIKVILNKSDVKYRNTLVYLDQYMCKVLRLWNSQGCETVYVYKYLLKMETLKQSGPWSSLGTHGSLVVIWWLCISSSGEDRNFIHGANVGPTWGRQKFYVKFDLEGQGQLPSKNNRDINQGNLHLWSKFCDPSWNGWWVMVWTSSKWGKCWLLSKHLTLKVMVNHSTKQ